MRKAKERQRRCLEGHAGLEFLFRQPLAPFVPHILFDIALSPWLCDSHNKTKGRNWNDRILAAFRTDRH